MRPGLRSLLFAPGDDERKVLRAVDGDADAVVLDLEDAVSVAAKSAARQRVAAVVAADHGARELIVRVNGVDTPWFAEDVAALRKAGARTLMLPKATIETVRAVPFTLAVIALIETALGVEEALAIARDRRVRRLMLGSADLAAELGIPLRSDETELHYPRARLAMASAAAGIEGPVDVVTLAVRDEDVLRISAERAKALGFTGKACIHPAQVAVVNEVFAPSEAELDWARQVVDAFDDAARSDRGVTTVDGRLVDAPVAARARRILDAAPAAR